MELRVWRHERRACQHAAAEHQLGVSDRAVVVGYDEVPLEAERCAQPVDCGGRVGV